MKRTTKLLIGGGLITAGVLLFGVAGLGTLAYAQRHNLLPHAQRNISRFGGQEQPPALPDLPQPNLPMAQTDTAHLDQLIKDGKLTEEQKTQYLALQKKIHDKMTELTAAETDPKTVRETMEPLIEELRTWIKDNKLESVLFFYPPMRMMMRGMRPRLYR